MYDNENGVIYDNGGDDTPLNVYDYADGNTGVTSLSIFSELNTTLDII